jgi:Arylsulfotransferase (ASST)
MKKTKQGEILEAPIGSTAVHFSRRAMLKSGLGVAGLGLAGATNLHASAAFRSGISPTARRYANARLQSSGDVSVYPLPGSRTASPRTEITIRGATADTLGIVTVTGSQSGAHTGLLKPHADGNGVSFVPDAPFRAEETVTVKADIPLGTGEGGSLTFDCVRPVAPPTIAAVRQIPDDASPTDPRTFLSRPDLRVPAINVTDPPNDTSPGYIFLGPRTPDNQTGPMIVDDEGEPIWFLPMENEVVLAGDFKVQEYKGEPVLTWWEGTLVGGHGFGHMEIWNNAYQRIAQIQVANGYSGADIHEFVITPQGTALIPVYNIVRWDLTAVDGPEEGVVTDSIIQEIEIESGRVLFEWHSLDHVGLDEANVDPPENPKDSWDYFHLNSIELDENDNFVVSARNTWAVYKIDRKSGEVLWRYSGKNSSFRMDDGTEVAYQHDARIHSNGRLSIFNNATTDPAAELVSRGIVVDLDENALTATLRHEYVHPSNIKSVSQGNMQVLPNNGTFVGWGSAPVFSEFSEDGVLRFNGRFQRGVQSYRAYRFPWVGQPDDAPAIATALASSEKVTVYASWNGATEVAIWRVLAGSGPDQLEEVDSAPRAGFETTITVQTDAPYIAVEALDKSGKSLGVSEAIEANPY